MRPACRVKLGPRARLLATKKTIAELEALGAIEKGADGRWRITEKGKRALAEHTKR